MSILLPPLSAAPPTKEEKLERLVLNIKQLSRDAYKTVSEVQKRGINMVWNHPSLTPQEIVDALGADAIKVFQYHGALTDYIVALSQAEGIQPDINLPSKAFVIDPQTGKITITEDPYVP